MDKKGVAGIDFMKSLAIGIFVLVVIFFALAIAGANLVTTGRTTTSGSVVNESGYLNNSGYTVENQGLTEFSGLSVSEIRNASNQLVIGSGNYTVSGSAIYNATSTTWADVDIDYSYNYKQDNQATGIITNFTGAIAGMGSSISTWITLGALVVLIAIIVVIIVVVNRVNGGGEGKL